jgi:hypothetical protein
METELSRLESGSNLGKVFELIALIARLDEHNRSVVESVHHLLQSSELVVLFEQLLGIFNQSPSPFDLWRLVALDGSHDFCRRLVVGMFGSEFLCEFRQSFFDFEGVLGLFEEFLYLLDARRSRAVEGLRHLRGRRVVGVLLFQPTGSLL